MKKNRLWMLLIPLLLIVAVVAVVVSMQKKNTDKTLIVNGEQDGQYVKQESDSFTVESATIRQMFKKTDFSGEQSVYRTYNQYALAEGGCYYIDFSGQCIQYFDRKLDESIYICNKPDCKHGTKDCNAYYDGYINNVFLYGGKLFVEILGFEDNIMTIYASNPDGTERKKLMTCSNASVEQFFAVKNKLYITYMLFGENGAHETMQACVEEVNLESGRHRRLCAFVPDEEHYNNWVGIAPCEEENKICIYYEYVSELMDAESYFSEGVVESASEDGQLHVLDEEAYAREFETYVEALFSARHVEYYVYDIEEEVLQPQAGMPEGLHSIEMAWVRDGAFYCISGLSVHASDGGCLYRNDKVLLNYSSCDKFLLLDDYLSFILYDEEDEVYRRFLYHLPSDTLYVSKKSIPDGAFEILSYSKALNSVCYDKNCDYSGAVLSGDVRDIGMSEAETYIKDNFTVYENEYSQVQWLEECD